MPADPRPPAGPRGVIGAAAEDAAAAYLEAIGWTLLARNIRLGADEIDIVARDDGDPPALVVVEVRSRSGRRFGSAIESMDARKVARLYRAALALRRGGHPAVATCHRLTTAWRVDLVAMRRAGPVWVVECHLRGLSPP
jgi:putative endonuclease